MLGGCDVLTAVTKMDNRLGAHVLPVFLWQNTPVQNRVRKTTDKRGCQEYCPLPAGERVMIRNSDSLWLSISIVWAALLLAALLLGSLFFVISN